jgi:AAA family ATP:ADP antiporter
MKYFLGLSKPQRKKFLLLGLLMGVILVINHILWGIKNTLIVHSAGAEALSLLKLVGTMPCAIFVTICYACFSHRYTRKELFYITLAPFFVFFLLFAFILYPHAHELHPSREWIENLSSLYPRWKTALLLYGNWSYALFYVISEMWPSVALSLLFWQLANDTTSLEEAKLFYPLFGIIANIAVAGAGGIIQFVASRGEYTQGLQTLTLIAVAFGLLVFFIQNQIEAPLIKASSHVPRGEEKPSFSFKESIYHLAKSKHLLLLACIVISFGVAQKIMESLWQDQLKLLHPTKASYNAFLGQLSWISGISTFALMGIATLLLQRFGSFFGPFYCFASLLLIATMLFFLFIITKEVAFLTVWIGSLQDIINKVMKACFCDPVKEMSYIPLDRELKIKGKAAVDVAADRFGKHGGAVIQQFLLVITAGTLVEIAPYLAFVSLAMIAIWLLSILRVERKTNQALRVHA